MTQRFLEPRYSGFLISINGASTYIARSTALALHSELVEALWNQPSNTPTDSVSETKKENEDGTRTKTADRQGNTTQTSGSGGPPTRSEGDSAAGGGRASPEARGGRFAAITTEAFGGGASEEGGVNRPSEAKGRWVCNACGNTEDKEREVSCWKCGKGEMIYTRPTSAGFDPEHCPTCREWANRHAPLGPKIEVKSELWDAAKLKMKQLEAQIQRSGASQLEKSNMLHTHSKLCMFAGDAWESFVVRPAQRTNEAKAFDCHERATEFTKEHARNLSHADISSIRFRARLEELLEEAWYAGLNHAESPVRKAIGRMAEAADQRTDNPVQCKECDGYKRGYEDVVRHNSVLQEKLKKASIWRRELHRKSRMLADAQRTVGDLRNGLYALRQVARRAPMADVIAATGDLLNQPYDKKAFAIGWRKCIDKIEARFRGHANYKKVEPDPALLSVIDWVRRWAPREPEARTETATPEEKK